MIAPHSIKETAEALRDAISRKKVTGEQMSDDLGVCLTRGWNLE